MASRNSDASASSMMTVCLFFMAKIGLDLSIFRKAGFVGQYGRRIFFLRSDPTSLSPAAGRIGIGVGDDFYALLVAADADAVDDTVAAGSMRLRWRGFASAAVCLLGVLGGWVAAPAASGPLSAARDDLIYVIAGGWHTEIAVPKGAIAGRLATVAAGFAGARYVVFGWGARGFYMAQNPGFADLLRAAVPGPAVVLVIPLSVSPGAYFGDANVWPIPVSPDGVTRLSRFLWDSMEKDRSGEPIRAGAGPYPQSIFYAATGDVRHLQHLDCRRGARRRPAGDRRGRRLLGSAN